MRISFRIFGTGTVILPFTIAIFVKQPYKWIAAMINPRLGSSYTQPGREEPSREPNLEESVRGQVLLAT